MILNGKMSKNVKRLMVAAGIFYGIPAAMLVVALFLRAMDTDTSETAICYDCDMVTQGPFWLSMMGIEYVIWAALIIAISLTLAAARLHKADSN